MLTLIKNIYSLISFFFALKHSFTITVEQSILYYDYYI